MTQTIGLVNSPDTTAAGSKSLNRSIADRAINSLLFSERNGLPTPQSLSQDPHRINALPAAGLEESPLLVDLTGAAGLALQQMGRAATVIAKTPTDYGHFLRLGLEARYVTGLLWGGLEEKDYLNVNRGIGGLIGLDPTEAGLEEKLQRLFAAQSGRPVLVVRDVTSFLAGLEQMGFSAAGLEEAARTYREAAVTLDVMQ